MYEWMIGLDVWFQWMLHASIKNKQQTTYSTIRRFVVKLVENCKWENKTNHKETKNTLYFFSWEKIYKLSTQTLVVLVLIRTCVLTGTTTV